MMPKEMPKKTGQQPKLTLVNGGKNSPLVEALYQQYQQSLLSYLSGIMPCGRQDAQEILHETYIRLLRHNDLARLEENPRAYIFTIATNLARDALRRRRSRKEDAHRDLDDYELETAEPSPMHSASWQQSINLLKQALLKLKPQTQKIFYLSRFEELTYPEIAKQLNLSSRTIERHMSTASQHLQIALREKLLIPPHTACVNKNPSPESPP